MKQINLFFFQLHYNSKTLKTESPNTSRGSSLPRTLSKESKLYGMKDTATSLLSSTIHSKTNTLLPPQPPPIPSGTYRQEPSKTIMDIFFPSFNLPALDLPAY